MPPQFTTLTSHAAPLPIDDVDTDQIVPSRYLKVTDKSGLGEGLFASWRYRQDGTPDPEFVLNQPGGNTAQILVTGHNFGCGSSREHAPWALLAEGIQAIVAPSFADIFRNNALKNGLLPVEIDLAFHRELLAEIEQDPGVELTIDLESQELTLPDGRRGRFPIDAFSKRCLLDGVDSLGYLLAMAEQIEAYEVDHE